MKVKYKAILSHFFVIILKLFRVLLNKIECLQGELGIPLDPWGANWKATNSLSAKQVNLTAQFNCV